MKSRKSFLIRIDPALYDALEAWAQQDFRSVNGQIEFVLREAVARRRRRPDSAASEPADAAHPPPTADS
jgi:hypothetical protein